MINKRFFIALTVLFLLTTALVPGVQAIGETGSLVVRSFTPAVGQLVRVGALLLKQENDLVGFSYKLRYDPGVIQFNSFTHSHLVSNPIGGFSAPASDLPNGIVTASSVSQTNTPIDYNNFTVGSDTLGTFVFGIQGPGACRVFIDRTDLNNTAFTRKDFIPFSAANMFDSRSFIVQGPDTTAPTVSNLMMSKPVINTNVNFSFTLTDSSLVNDDSFSLTVQLFDGTNTSPLSVSAPETGNIRNYTGQIASGSLPASGSVITVTVTAVDPLSNKSVASTSDTVITWPLTAVVQHKTVGGFVERFSSDTVRVVINTEADSLLLEAVGPTTNPPLVLFAGASVSFPGFDSGIFSGTYVKGQDYHLSFPVVAEGTWVLRATGYAYGGNFGDTSFEVSDTFSYDSTPPIMGEINSNLKIMNDSDRDVLADTDGLLITGTDAADTVKPDTPGIVTDIQVLNADGSILLDWTPISSLPLYVNVNSGNIPGSDTTIRIFIRVRDAARNVSSADSDFDITIDVQAPDTSLFTGVSDKLISNTVTIDVPVIETSSGVTGSLFYRHGATVPNFTEADSITVGTSALRFTIPAAAIGTETTTDVEYYIIINDTWGHQATIGSAVNPSTFGVIVWPLSVLPSLTLTNGGTVQLTINTQADSFRIAAWTVDADTYLDSGPFVVGRDYGFGVDTTFTIWLNEGVNLVTVRAWDSAAVPNNFELTLTVQQDVTKPIISSVSINSDTTFTNVLPISVQVVAADNDTGAGLQNLTVSGDIGVDTTVTVSSNTTTVTVQVVSGTDGVRTVNVIVSDRAGNVSDTVSDTIILDQTASTVTINPLNADNTVTSETQFITWTAEDQFGTPTQFTAVHTWRGTDGNDTSDTKTGVTTLGETFILKDGLNTIKVTAKDLAGNTTSSTYVVIFVNADTVFTGFTPGETTSTGDTGALIIIGPDSLPFVFVGDPTDPNLDTVIFRMRSVNEASGGNDTINIEFNPKNTAGNFTFIMSRPDTSVGGFILTAIDNTPEIQAQASKGLSTLREITFLKNGVDVSNDTNQFDTIIITIDVNPALASQNPKLWVYNPATQKFEEVKVQSFDGSKIVATREHFSIFMVAPGGLAPRNNVADVIIFPNPYRPNDGNPATGAPYSGSAVWDGTGMAFNVPNGNITIKIFDILGRTVDEFSANVTTGVLVWDVKNKSNEDVASGVYIVLIEGTGGKAVKKIAVIR